MTLLQIFYYYSTIGKLGQGKKIATTKGRYFNLLDFTYAVPVIALAT